MSIVNKMEPEILKTTPPEYANKIKTAQKVEIQYQKVEIQYVVPGNKPMPDNFRKPFFMLSSTDTDVCLVVGKEKYIRLIDSLKHGRHIGEMRSERTTTQIFKYMEIMNKTSAGCTITKAERNLISIKTNKSESVIRRFLRTLPIDCIETVQTGKSVTYKMLTDLQTIKKKRTAVSVEMGLTTSATLHLLKELQKGLR